MVAHQDIILRPVRELNVTASLIALEQPIYGIQVPRVRTPRFDGAFPEPDPERDELRDGDDDVVADWCEVELCSDVAEEREDTGNCGKNNESQRRLAERLRLDNPGIQVGVRLDNGADIWSGGEIQNLKGFQNGDPLYLGWKYEGLVHHCRPSRSREQDPTRNFQSADCQKRRHIPSGPSQIRAVALGCVSKSP